IAPRSVLGSPRSTRKPRAPTWPAVSEASVESRRVIVTSTPCPTSARASLVPVYPLPTMNHDSDMGEVCSTGLTLATIIFDVSRGLARRARRVRWPAVCPSAGRAGHAPAGHAAPLHDLARRRAGRDRRGDRALVGVG